MDRHLHPAHPLLTSKRANSFKGRVARMSTSHFTIVMGTGVWLRPDVFSAKTTLTLRTQIIGTLLLNVGTAWGHGQRVLEGFAAAFYVLAAALFIIFSTMSVLRYIWFPEVWKVMIAHETHSLYLGCIPMAFVTSPSALLPRCIDD